MPDQTTPTRSVERLHHFRCGSCRMWWSIGDAPDDKHKWFCPWCGTENTYEPVQQGGIPSMGTGS